MFRRAPTIIVTLAVVLFAACEEIQRPKVEPFFAATQPPPKQELRWSNGKLPKSIDPANAIAAPETDIVRAVYEGLTELDSKTLREMPAVAESWESPDEGRSWIFHLRKDARWSNSQRVTAADFVRSWKRLRERGASKHLHQNIRGMTSATVAGEDSSDYATDFLQDTPAEADPGSEAPARNSDPVRPDKRPQGASKSAEPFGVEAVDDVTLRVALTLPDKDFPRLVANPVFRPVYSDPTKLEKPRPDASTVTNGAFRMTEVNETVVTLERSETYWNKRGVALERIRFHATATPEAALDAYRKGEVDVVTNAAFAPAALKVLAPYDDFRRTTHSALNFYEFNVTKVPFDDRRVREALAVAIDREKLVQSELAGSSLAAFTLLPLSTRREALAFDAARAKELFAKAGYTPDIPFPPVRLVVNRNDTQQRVARFVAKMWKQHLGIETSIVVKETAEMDAVREAGDYDVIRRGLVMPVNDEVVNLAALLGDVKKKPDDPSSAETPPVQTGGPSTSDQPATEPVVHGPMSITEDDAIFEVRLIPLYFPSSYSLVKPYVLGFETNGLDAPSLKDVRIDSEWRPKP